MPRRVPYAHHPDGFCEVHGDAERRALVIHGGFWRDAYDLSLMDALCEDLVARGWETWNVEYRRLGHGDAWPEMSADVRSPRARLPLGIPQLLVHGTLDDCVPVQMSRDYAAAGRGEVTLVERPGEGRFEHLDPRSGAWQDVVAWLS